MEGLTEEVNIKPGAKLPTGLPGFVAWGCSIVAASFPYA